MNLWTSVILIRLTRCSIVSASIEKGSAKEKPNHAEIRDQKDETPL